MLEKQVSTSLGGYWCHFLDWDAKEALPSWEGKELGSVMDILSLKSLKDAQAE